MRVFGIGACIIVLLIGAGNTSFGDNKRVEACALLVQYMAEYHRLYQASGPKTDPKEVAALRAGLEHKLMDYGIQAEIFVALARYEFACRACFYLGWDSECAQMPHYSEAVVDLAGCIE